MYRGFMLRRSVTVNTVAVTSSLAVRSSSLTSASRNVGTRSDEGEGKATRKRAFSLESDEDRLRAKIEYLRSKGLRFSVGDWICSNCDQHNYANNVWCHKCHKEEKPNTVFSLATVTRVVKQVRDSNKNPNTAARTSDAGDHISKPGVKKTLKPGDWVCGSCGTHNYADKRWCYACNLEPSPSIKEKLGEHRRRGIELKRERLTAAAREESKGEGEDTPESTRLPLSRLPAHLRIMRKGDWICQECRAHNFRSKELCHICGKGEKPLLAEEDDDTNVGKTPPLPIHHETGPPAELTVAGAIVRTGDWFCLKCNHHNFKERVMCFRCSAAVNDRTPRVKKGDGHAEKRFWAGDWICRVCKEHNMGRNDICFTSNCRGRQPHFHREKFSIGAIAAEMAKRGGGGIKYEIRKALKNAGLNDDEIKGKFDAAGKVGTLRGIEGVFMPGDWICLNRDADGKTCKVHNKAQHRKCKRCGGSSVRAHKMAQVTAVITPQNVAPDALTKPPPINPTAAEELLSVGFIPREEKIDIPPLPAQMTDVTHDDGTDQVAKRIISVGRKKKKFWLCSRCATYNAPGKLACIACAAERPKYLDPVSTALDSEDSKEKAEFDRALQTAKINQARDEKKKSEVKAVAKTQAEVKQEIGDGTRDDLHFAETNKKVVDKQENEERKEREAKRVSHNKKLAVLVDRIQRSREAMMNMWLCIQCHTVNDAGRKSCSACGFENPNPPPTPEERRKAAAEELRRLTRDLFLEKQAKKRQAEKENAERLAQLRRSTPSLATNAKLLGGGYWLCTNCETRNDPQAGHCRGCTLMRPGYKSPEQVWEERKAKRHEEWLESERRRKEMRRTKPSHFVGLRTIAGDSWLCMNCHTVNLIDADMCRACAQSKPESSSSPASKQEGKKEPSETPPSKEEEKKDEVTTSDNEEPEAPAAKDEEKQDEGKDEEAKK